MDVIRNDYDCQICSKPSGYSIVCPPCRVRLTKSEKKKMLIIMHEIARNMAQVDDWYQCWHCEEPKARNQICADHFPHTRGARPDLTFDTRNCRPACAFCNTSGNSKRKTPTEDDLSPFYHEI